MAEFTDAELAAFLDEALPPSRSAELEHHLRTDAALRHRLTEVTGRQSAGLHTIGGIWRRNRLSCPDRSELGQYILGTLDEERADYIRFHLEQVGCRYCAANLADLEAAAAGGEETVRRRTKYFQTSVGHLGS
ncbi:hypothetical protein [Crateriforma spongiae]|uniref:hypothetical protein n=1 Tax=Crateriforma spongiae TaxID=2724528 RepID=UPI0039B05936